MNKKLILFSLSIVLLLGSTGVLCIKYLNTGNETAKNDNILEVKTANVQAIYDEIPSLDKLKNDSDIIVEIVGTNRQEKVDYKGIPAVVTLVKVNEVIKGKIDSTELKIFQDSRVDIAPKDGEVLLMFLKKGIDNPDCYLPIGGGQGIYKILTDDTSKADVLRPQSLVNNNILNELKGKYKDVKLNLKE